MKRFNFVFRHPGIDLFNVFLILFQETFGTVIQTHSIFFSDIMLQTDFFGRAVFHHDPLVQESHMVAQFCGFLHVVGGQENCHALLFQFQQHFMDFNGRGRVQARGGFIQKQHFRVMQYSPCKDQPLGLSFGKLSCRLILVLIQAYLFQDFRYSVFLYFQDFSKILQVLIYSEIFIDTAVVRDDPNLFINGLVNVFGINAKDICLTGSLS